MMSQDFNRIAVTSLHTLGGTQLKWKMLEIGSSPAEWELVEIILNCGKMEAWCVDGDEAVKFPCVRIQ